MDSPTPKTRKQPDLEIRVRCIEDTPRYAAALRFILGYPETPEGRRFSIPSEYPAEESEERKAV